MFISLPLRQYKLGLAAPVRWFTLTGLGGPAHVQALSRTAWVPPSFPNTIILRQSVVVDTRSGGFSLLKAQPRGVLTSSVCLFLSIFHSGDLPMNPERP